MSDVRFACPFCAQHIACDRSFSGTAIDCPACGARITVPQPLALGLEQAPIRVAFPAPRPPDLGLWSEEAWRAHARQHPGIYSVDDSRWNIAQLPVPLAMLLPVLVVLGASGATMWTTIVVGALISGYAVRRANAVPEGHPVISGAAFVLGIIYYGILVEVFLLGGCCWPGRVI